MAVDSDGELRQRAAVAAVVGFFVAVAWGGMVASGSSMPLDRVAAAELGVKGEPACGRSLRDP